MVEAHARLRQLQDRSVLITGAGRGVGKRLAIGFATAGARVALVARSKAELDLAHLEIEHAGGNAQLCSRCVGGTQLVWNRGSVHS